MSVWRADDFVADVTVWTTGVDETAFIEEPNETWLTWNHTAFDDHLLMNVPPVIEHYSALWPQLEAIDRAQFFAPFVESVAESALQISWSLRRITCFKKAF